MHLKVQRINKPNIVIDFILFLMLQFCFIAGRAEIRDDIHSDAKELVIFSDVEASSEAKLASLNQPRMGYTSQRGLYIRVVKPIDKGHFNFVYGVFQETGLSVMCTYPFNFRSVHGKDFSKQP